MFMCRYPHRNGCYYCHLPCTNSCLLFKSVGNFEQRLTVHSFWRHCCIACLWSFRTPTTYFDKNRMPANNSNCHSRINLFDITGLSCHLSEPEPLHSFASIDAVLQEPEEPLEDSFWDDPQSVSMWNSYRTEAAANRGGLKINDLVFKDFGTGYHGLHVDCEHRISCHCTHNYGGIQTTQGRALNTQPTIDSQETIKPRKVLKSPSIPEIFIRPPSIEDPKYNW